MRKTLHHLVPKNPVRVSTVSVDAVFCRCPFCFKMVPKYRSRSNRCDACGIVFDPDSRGTMKAKTEKRSHFGKIKSKAVKYDGLDKGVGF